MFPCSPLSPAHKAEACSRQRAQDGVSEGYPETILPFEHHRNELCTDQGSSAGKGTQPQEEGRVRSTPTLYKEDTEPFLSFCSDWWEKKQTHHKQALLYHFFKQAIS